MKLEVGVEEGEVEGLGQGEALNYNSTTYNYHY